MFGVRLRSAIAATAVVAVALAGAGGAFVWQYQRDLIANVDETATDRARDIAADVAAAKGAIGPRLIEPSGEVSLAQVVDARGVVVASTPGLRPPWSPMASVRPAAGAVVREDRTIVAGGAPFRVVAIGVKTPRGTYTVEVAQSLRVVGSSVDSALTLLAAGFPVLLLVVGSATFFFVGRSLRPVEAIRSRVATISARELAARVPVPPVRDEVGRLAETMNAMLDRLDSAVSSQRRFVADASHELRSPLATLHAGLELLPVNADTEPVVTTLREETDRLERLVAGMLLLARADDQGLVQRRSDVDLDDLVLAERIRLTHAEPHLIVSASIQPVRVRGDSHQLAQALRNLVDNAARHARTTVTLSVYEEAGRALVDVDDDGPGIPLADRERIFERFVRLDESRVRDTGGGSGLGLAIVTEIARAHGGRVQVADPVAGPRAAGAGPAGTLMRLEFPLAGGS